MPRVRSVCPSLVDRRRRADLRFVDGLGRQPVKGGPLDPTRDRISRDAVEADGEVRTVATPPPRPWLVARIVTFVEVDVVGSTAGCARWRCTFRSRPVLRARTWCGRATYPIRNACQAPGRRRAGPSRLRRPSSLGRRHHATRRLQDRGLISCHAASQSAASRARSRWAVLTSYAANATSARSGGIPAETSRASVADRRACSKRSGVDPGHGGPPAMEVDDRTRRPWDTDLGGPLGEPPTRHGPAPAVAIGRLAVGACPIVSRPSGRSADLRPPR